jgi:ABC-type multidrug transport system fused ATPase/permease subunit
MKSKNRPNSKSPGIFKSLLPIIKRHKLLLILTISSLLVEIGVDIFLAKVLGGLADSAVNNSMKSLNQFLQLVVVLLVVNTAVKFLGTYGAGKFSENCLYDIRIKTFRDITQLPVSFLDKNPSGDLVSRVTSDLGLVQNFLQGTLGNVVATPIRVIVCTLFLFLINWKLAIFSMVCIPFLFFLTMKVNAPVEKYTKKQQEELGKVNALAQDSISGLTVAKAFTLEHRLKERYNAAVDKSVASGLKAIFYSAITKPWGIAMGFLPFVLIFGFGGYLCIKGELAFGSLLTFIQTMNYVVNPLSDIPNLLNGLRSASAGTERLSEIWQEPKERNNGESYNIKDQAVIQFDDVYFDYDDGKEVTRGLSFTIMQGEKVALVGPSGCGKSTVLRLISGFYSEKKGSIKLYGHSIYNWRLSKMRGLMALVSQDNFLFPDSIYNNIAYGKPEASKKDVASAADIANIKNFIEALPNQYDTLAGERGARLSGGQKQRIAIARALLKNSPILLLDEATSALDTESEMEVQKALKELMSGKTALIIAHRLSTIKDVDRILVMDDGRIVEEGTHEELMEKGSLYSQLYAKQFVEEVSAVG